MKIAMVGYGRMARVHSECFRRIAGVELDTLVGARQEPAEAFARQHGYPHVAYDLSEALSRWDVDAVIICTPSQRHAHEAEVALRAGKHVLCEIPLALSLQEADALVRLAAQQDRRLMVCHTERFEAGRMALRRRIAEGELHPLHVVACFHMLRRGQMQTGPERRGWDDDVLWHHGCHVVDGVLSLLGDERVTGLRAQFGPPWPGLDRPLDVDLQWRSPAGVTVSISLSHNAHWGVHEYRVIGVEDTLVADHGVLRNREGVLVEAGEPHGDVLRQDEEFVASVRQGREPEVSGRAVLPVMRVLQAAWDQR